MLRNHFSCRVDDTKEYQSQGVQDLDRRRALGYEMEPREALEDSSSDLVDRGLLDALEPVPIDVNQMQVVMRYDLNMPNNHFFRSDLSGGNVPPTMIAGEVCEVQPYSVMSYNPLQVTNPLAVTNEGIIDPSFRPFLQLKTPMNSIAGRVDVMPKANHSGVSSVLFHHVINNSMESSSVPTLMNSSQYIESLTKHSRPTKPQSEMSKLSIPTPSAVFSNSQEPFTDDRWDVKFAELQRFVKMHGHARVPGRYHSNVSLSKWAIRQRYQYKLKQDGKHSTLTDVREAKLAELGFQWDIRCTVWEERFDELLEFTKKYGHMSVPIVCPDFPKLGSWVKCARRQGKLFARGEPSTMTLERASKLRAVGFTWEARGLPPESSLSSSSKGNEEEV